MELDLNKLMDAEHITNKKRKSLKPKVEEANNNSTPKECYTKSARREAGWYSWSESTITEGYLETLANELFEWADTQTEAIKLRPFFRQKKIHYDDVKGWRRKSATFNRIYEEALCAIGDRREVKAFNNQANAGIQMKTAHLYDPEWAEVNKYHSDMKKAEEAEKQELHVHFDEVPASALVTKRKKK